LRFKSWVFIWKLPSLSISPGADPLAWLDKPIIPGRPHLVLTYPRRVTKVAVPTVSSEMVSTTTNPAAAVVEIQARQVVFVHKKARRTQRYTQ